MTDIATIEANPDVEARLKDLAHLGDKVALIYGWSVNDYLIQEAGPNWTRSDLTEAANYLSTQVTDTDLRRVTIIDRARVARYFNRERYAELPGKPSFHVLRACYVGGDWPNADAEKTEALVTWAIEHGHDGQWASPHEINAHKNNRPEEQPWQVALRNIIKWCWWFIERTPDNMRKERDLTKKFLQDVTNITSQTDQKSIK